MNIVSLHKHSFPHRRTEKETPEQFVSHYANTEHASIIKEIAEKNNLTFENTVAMAMAMFCSIEDLMMFHYPVDVPGFSITVNDKGEGAKKIISWRGKLKAPYLKSITEIHDIVKKFLVLQHGKDNTKLERLEVERTGREFYSDEERKVFLKKHLEKSRATWLSYTPEKRAKRRDFWRKKHKKRDRGRAKVREFKLMRYKIWHDKILTD